MQLPRQHRVVVVGGGFGGLVATRTLKRAPVRVTLVARSANHLFQPLLYQYATGILDEGEIAPPLRQVLARQRNVRVLLAEVDSFDLEGRVVTGRTPDGRGLTLAYDSLIVAAGAHSSYFGHNELALHSTPMKTIDDALALRRRIFGAFETAELATDPDTRRSWLTFAVVGAGPTGVELAGQLRELATRTLRDEFRSIDPSHSRVVLFDGGPEPLPRFGDQLASRAEMVLRGLGVELRMGRVVTAIDGDGLMARGSNGAEERLETHTVIWAAGVQASPLARMLADASGAGCDRHGRVEVLPDCTLPGHPEVFCAGDMVSLRGLTGMAEAAMQMGRYAARTIKRRAKGQGADRPFRYIDLGSMAYLSRGQAVVSFHGLRFHGFIGWLMWLVVHITFLTGFKNRVSALFTWVTAFGGRARNQRALALRDIEQRPPAAGRKSA
jgi:NADH dehydrogenase